MSLLVRLRLWLGWWPWCQYRGCHLSATQHCDVSGTCLRCDEHPCYFSTECFDLHGAQIVRTHGR